MDFLQEISLAGIVPVVKLDRARDAVPLGKALIRGGLPAAEITFRTAAAGEALSSLRQAYPDMLLCAGTVLTVQQADTAIRAGASAIVTPGLNPKVVEYCLEREIPVCPGISTPTELEAALGYGLKAVKVFPAEAVGGLKLLKSLAAPYSGVQFMPTGGITEQNMTDYLSFSRVLCCGGSWMVPESALARGDFAEVESLTRAAVRKMLGLRVEAVRLSSSAAPDSVVRFCALMGIPVQQSSSDTSTDVNGEIHLFTRDLRRAVWHLARRGFAFVQTEDPRKMRLSSHISGLSVLLCGEC